MTEKKPQESLNDTSLDSTEENGGNSQDFDFDEVLNEVIELVSHEKRVSTGRIKMEFHLDNEKTQAITDEIVDARRLATLDAGGKVLVWTGGKIDTTFNEAHPPFMQDEDHLPPEVSQSKPIGRGPFVIKQKEA